VIRKHSSPSSRCRCFSHGLHSNLVVRSYSSWSSRCWMSEVKKVHCSCRKYERSM